MLLGRIQGGRVHAPVGKPAKPRNMKLDYSDYQPAASTVRDHKEAVSGASNPLMDVCLESRLKIVRYLASRVGNIDVAEDLFNDLWLKLQHADNVRPINCEGYVYRMASNIVIDHMRREGVARRTKQELEQLNALDVGQSITPERQLIASEEVLRMKKVIADLPNLSRQIFFMNRFEGLSQREIASRVNLSPTMVFKHIRMVLDRLSLEDSD